MIVNWGAMRKEWVTHLLDKFRRIHASCRTCKEMRDRTEVEARWRGQDKAKTQLTFSLSLATMLCHWLIPTRQPRLTFCTLHRTEEVSSLVS